MKVEIMSSTPDPIGVISRAAGTCYGKDDVSFKRVSSCFKSGHMSVFEHASVTFRIEGISRACSHQLVRHRVASFSQQSQRYCKIDTHSCDWYVVPPEIVDKWTRAEFDKCMVDCAQAYRDALDDGIKPEDARYLLPESTKTTIVVTMNCRELFHFLDVRMTKQAQWEIRNLAKAMRDALLEEDGWKDLVSLREEG